MYTLLGYYIQTIKIITSMYYLLILHYLVSQNSTNFTNSTIV